MTQLLLALVLAASLPTYDDFRRMDRLRRLTGQMHTADLLQLTQVDSGLIARTVQEHADDPQILWGAAELLGPGPGKRDLFDSAMVASKSNASVTLRFACLLAQSGDFEPALRLLRHCQKNDSSNLAPWLAQLWILKQQKKKAAELPAPPPWAAEYRDYSAEAARARIRLLEAAGYSPYSARRLGFMPDSHLLSIVRDLAKPPIEPESAPILLLGARAMQRGAPFLLTELVGQTLERAVLVVRADAEQSPEVRVRSMELDMRREELKALLADVERNTVDLATEAEMVQYFDTLLATGEEHAMKRLAETVRRQPAQ